MISLASYVARYLALHRIVRWTGVSGQLEADIFVCLNIKDNHRIFMCRSEDKDIRGALDGLNSLETHSMMVLNA
jgi:hypothetical protein